jgi:hypothetical protein
VPDDLALFEYARARRLPTYVHVPNLVEHADVPSVAGNSYAGRRLSSCFANESLDFGSEFDPIVGLRVLPFIAWASSECCWLTRLDSYSRTWFEVDARLALERQKHDTRALRAVISAAKSNGLIADLPIEPVWLEDLLITSFGLGMVAAGVNAPVDLSPIARVALSTLTPGSLRTKISESVLDVVQRAFGPYIEEACWSGILSVETSGSLPFDDVELSSWTVGPQFRFRHDRIAKMLRDTTFSRPLGHL